MSERIAPALTPEEWAEFPNWPEKILAFDRGGWPLEEVRPIYFPTRHGIAAANLHGQPFGFTRDLLTRLRHAPRLTQLDAETFAISREDLRVLLGARTEAASRIEALLPPEGV